MSSVYSARLLISTGSNASVQIPAGQTAVVKSISAWNSNNTGSANFNVTISGIGAIIAWGHLDAYAVTAATAFQLLNMHHVVNAGETLAIASSAGVYVMVSGYLLGP